MASLHPLAPIICCSSTTCFCKGQELVSTETCLCALPSLLLAVTSQEPLQSSTFPLEMPCSLWGCNVRGHVRSKKGIYSMNPDHCTSKGKEEKGTDCKIKFKKQKTNQTKKTHQKLPNKPVNKQTKKPNKNPSSRTTEAVATR